MAYLGIDVGSVSTNVVVMGDNNELYASLYIRTQGRPIEAILSSLAETAKILPPGVEITAAGTTGSGRYLAGVMVGADVIKNEMPLHYMYPMSKLF